MTSRLASVFASSSFVLLAACSGGVETAPAASGTGGASATTTTTTTSVSSASGTGGTSSTGSSMSTGGTAPVCTNTSGSVVLAVDKLFLGDTDPDGTKDTTNGWRQYGFNIDGLDSTPASTDLCQPYPGASSANVYTDGNNGIDNSFGENILPMLLSVSANLSQTVNGAIASGQFTLLFKLDGLGSGADAGPVAAKMYVAGPLGSAAKFDGSDCWPVSQDNLSNPTDIESTTIAFPMSAVANNMWSSNGTSTLTLSFPLSGFALKLTIHDARLSMVLDADHAGATAGQIGGVLDREELADAVRDLASTFGLGCMDATTEMIVNQLRDASDIMNDGTQDPTQQCNGISIGLGFTAKADGLGPIGPATPAAPDPCP